MRDAGFGAWGVGAIDAQEARYALRGEGSANKMNCRDKIARADETGRDEWPGEHMEA